MPQILDLSMYGIGDGDEEDNDDDEEQKDVIDLTMDQHGDDQTDAESEREDEDDDDEEEDGDSDEETESDEEDNDGDEEQKDVIDLTIEQDGDDQTDSESEREDEDDDDPCPGYNYMIVNCRVTGRKRDFFGNVPWWKPHLSIIAKKLYNRNINWRWKCILNPARCHATFVRSGTLWTHMETKHILGGRPFRCGADGCSKKFTHKSALMTHIRGKHLAPFNGDWKWKCKACGQAYNCAMQARRCCRDANHNR